MKRRWERDPFHVSRLTKLLTAAYRRIRSGYSPRNCAVASIIIFLTWLWLSNLALLVGAEVNDVLAELRKDKSPAAAELAREEKPPTEKSAGQDAPPKKHTNIPL